MLCGKRLCESHQERVFYLFSCLVYVTQTGFVGRLLCSRNDWVEHRGCFTQTRGLIEHVHISATGSEVVYLWSHDHCRHMWYHFNVKQCVEAHAVLFHIIPLQDQHSRHSPQSQITRCFRYLMQSRAKPLSVQPVSLQCIIVDKQMLLSCYWRRRLVFLHREGGVSRPRPPVQFVGSRLFLRCRSPREEDRWHACYPDQRHSMLLPDAVCHASYDLLQVWICNWIQFSLASFTLHPILIRF